MGGISYIPSSNEHFFIRNYFRCYEPRENIITYRFTTFGSANDEGFVVTINGIYTKSGNDNPIFLPYHSKEKQLNFEPSEAIFELLNKNSVLRNEIPGLFTACSKIVEDYEEKELQERKFIENFGKALNKQSLIPVVDEKPRNFFCV